MLNIENPDEVMKAEYRGCNTLWNGFKQTVQTMPDENFLGTRGTEENDKGYKWQTYKQIDEKVSSFA
jgi:hypothetical protein